MPAVVPKKSKQEVTVVSKIRNYSKEPAFRKKAEKASEFIKKHGLPKSKKK